MLNILAVFVGGGIGAVCRYLITLILSEAASLVEVVHTLPKNMPVAYFERKRMTPSLAFCTLPKKRLSIVFERGDPMHLLPVPDLLITNGLV